MAEFGSLDLQEMAGEDARLHKEGTGNFLEQFVPMPEVKPGQTASIAVRILPPRPGAKLFQYNRTHKLNGRSIHCPRPLVNGKWDRNVPCPICEANSAVWKVIEKLKKAGKLDEAEKLKKAEADPLKAQERYYYNAIVRSMVADGKEVKNVGPRILSVGVILHRIIIRAITGVEGDPESKLGNITDLKNGWDFIIRRSASSGDGYVKYEGSGFSRNPSAAGTADEITKWAAALHDLTKLRNPKDLEYLEKELAIYKGLIQDDTDTAFDNEGFEAKWRKKAQDSADDLADSEGAVQVVVNAPRAAPVKMDAPAPKSKTVEDDKFLDEIKALEAQAKS